MHSRLGELVCPDENGRRGSRTCCTIGVRPVLATSHCKFQCDPVCGGKRKLSLFRSEERCNAERYCQPDCLMTFGLENPLVRLILEIDEPTEVGLCTKHLAGNPHAANMCRYLIDPGNNPRA